MEDDHRAITNYACQQLQSTEDSRLEMEKDATKCLRLIEIQMQQIKLDYVESCQHLLKQRKQYLQKVYERKMEKIHELEIKEHMVVIRPTCTTIMSDNNSDGVTSSKWLEEMLDENYFPSSSPPAAPVPNTTVAAAAAATDASNDGNDHFQQPPQHHHRPSNSNSISDWVVCGY
jgi:hypothetical protein